MSPHLWGLAVWGPSPSGIIWIPRGENHIEIWAGVQSDSIAVNFGQVS